MYKKASIQQARKFGSQAYPEPISTMSRSRPTTGSRHAHPLVTEHKPSSRLSPLPSHRSTTQQNVIRVHAGSSANVTSRQNHQGSTAKLREQFSTSPGRRDSSMKPTHSNLQAEKTNITTSTVYRHGIPLTTTMEPIPPFLASNPSSLTRPPVRFDTIEPCIQESLPAPLTEDSLEQLRKMNDAGEDQIQESVAKWVSYDNGFFPRDRIPKQLLDEEYDNGTWNLPSYI